MTFWKSFFLQRGLSLAAAGSDAGERLRDGDEGLGLGVGLGDVDNLFDQRNKILPPKEAKFLLFDEKKMSRVQNVSSTRERLGPQQMRSRHSERSMPKRS